MIQLYEIVGNMETRLSTCVENQVAAESALRAIAGLCQDNTNRTVTQGAAIKILQAQTDSIQTRLADVKDKTDSNTRHTALATRNINSLQADQSAINNQLESIKARLKMSEPRVEGKGLELLHRLTLVKQAYLSAAYKTSKDLTTWTSLMTLSLLLEN